MSAGSAPPSPRLVSVWVPDWPVVALTMEAREQRRALESGGAPSTAPGAASGPSSGRGRAEAVPDPALVPVAVIGGRGVVAASAPARTAGVARGMRLRVARSLCPGLVVLPPSPERESRGFERVMDALSRVLADPIVVRPGLALSGARGPARWAGGEEPLAQALAEAVAEGPEAECQVGIADSLLGAVLAARRGVIVEPGGTAGFLAPWPLDALLAGLPTQRAQSEARELIEILGRLGIRSLGDLAALPRKDVAARFGPIGERAHRLASAASTEVPRTGRPASDVVARTALDPPVDRSDRASFAARALAEDLSERLVSRGLATGRLLVEARCEDGAELSRSWVLETTPTPAELTDRVRWQLEGWLSGRSGRPPSAPLVSLSLTALELVPAGASQAGLWSAPGEQGRRRARRSAERVESLLGAGGVLQPLLVPGRDPRGRVRLVPWGEAQEDGALVAAGESAAVRSGRRTGGAGQPGRRGGSGGAARGPAPVEVPWSGSLPSPSPSVVPERPVPVLVRADDGVEVGVGADGFLDAVPAEVRLDPEARHGGGERLVGAEWTPIESWAGPWAVDEGWWRARGASRRAYLQVVLEGGRALLLVRSGRWWLDGAYD